MELCVEETVLPETLKIELFTGDIVNISLPLGVPVNGTPNPIVVPLTIILDGVEEDKEAEPPDIDNSKSDTSIVDVAFAEPP